MNLKKAAVCCAALAATGAALPLAEPAGASVGGGNVAVSWSIPSEPDGGVSNVTFPMTVNPGTARQSGTYFAEQFDFTGSSDVGYIGLQPRPDSRGTGRLHAAFSSFISGTTSSDDNCSNGADGGAGVSCAVDFDATYGHTYDLTVRASGANTWTGTATDTTTGDAVPIGTYQLPAGSGGLSGSQAGFVEYYAGVRSCAQEPQVDVVFGGPVSSSDGPTEDTASTDDPTATDGATATEGAITGTARSGGEYSDCVGRANYTATDVGAGVRITRGSGGADSESSSDGSSGQ